MEGCATPVSKTYNTVNWPGACGRDVVSSRLDGGALPDIGLLKLTFHWDSGDAVLDNNFSALKVAHKYLDEAFKQSTVDSYRPLRMQGHFNKGNCALTDGPAAAISGNKDEQYNKQLIPHYLAATIVQKKTELSWITLKFSADICNPNNQGNPICDYLDTAMGKLSALPGFVADASQFICKALNPDMEPKIEQCPPGFS